MTPPAAYPLSDDHGAWPTSRALGLSLRAETPEDRPFLLALYRSTREAELARTGWGEAQIQPFIEMQLNAQSHHYRHNYPGAAYLVLCLPDGTPTGRLYLVELTDDLHLLDISLMPDHRSKGYGTALFADLMATASTLGKGLTIHVEKMNPARRLYTRLGFEVVEDKDLYDMMRWQPSGTAYAGHG